MKKLISFGLAARINIIIYILLILFHLFMIIGSGVLDLVPYDMVWGGNIESQGQFLVMETVAALVVVVFLLLNLIKSRKLRIEKLYKIAHYSMWVIFVYFVLNTLGNILGTTVFEKSMSVVSLILSVLTLRMALEKDKY
jgi:hypothetical protein